MNKRFVIVTLATSIALTSNAQLVEAIEPFLQNWLEPAYPLIAGIIFLIGVFINMGKFTNSDGGRDIKSGIVNISIFLIIAVAIPVIYRVIRNTSL